MSKSLHGLDALLSIVQMPSGIPVATVGIDNAKNAAILAAKILALSDQNLNKKLIEYQQQLGQKVSDKNSKLQEIGYQQYIKDFLNKN